jgi:hypothetical protein
LDIVIPEVDPQVCTRNTLLSTYSETLLFVFQTETPFAENTQNVHASGYRDHFKTFLTPLIKSDAERPPLDYYGCIDSMFSEHFETVDQQCIMDQRYLEIRTVVEHIFDTNQVHSNPTGPDFTEVQALCAIVRLEARPDVKAGVNMMLMDNLHSAIEQGIVVCAGGRLARIAASAIGFDIGEFSVYNNPGQLRSEIASLAGRVNEKFGGPGYINGLMRAELLALAKKEHPGLNAVDLQEAVDFQGQFFDRD